MNIEALQLFREIVRRHSFTRAARAMGVSQSAASQALAHMEAELDAILIDRSKRPFALTPEGATFYDSTRKMLKEYEKATTQIRNTRTQVAGTVRVAAIYSVGLHVMSRHIQQFMGQYPKATIRLEYLHPNKVIDAVIHEDVDLGLVSFPQANRVLEVTPLRSERMVFVCKPDHRLGKEKKVDLSELDGEALIAFDPDLAIRKFIDRCLRQHRATPNILMEFDNIETIKQALEIGTGVAILPEPTVEKEVLQGSLCAIPTTDEDLTRPVGIIYRRHRRLTPATRRFMDLLKEPA